MNPVSHNNSSTSTTVVNLGHGTNNASDPPFLPKPNTALQRTLRPPLMVTTPTISESADKLKLNLPKSFRGHDVDERQIVSPVDFEGQSAVSKDKPYSSPADSNDSHVGGSYFSTPGAHLSTSPNLTIRFPAPSSPMTTLPTLSVSSPEQHFVSYCALTIPAMPPLSLAQVPAHNQSERSHNENSISHSALTPTPFSLPVLAKVDTNIAEGCTQYTYAEIESRPSPDVVVPSGILHLGTGATPKSPFLGNKLDTPLPSCFHFTFLYTEGLPCEHYSLTSHYKGEATADDTTSQQTIETAPSTFDVVGNPSPFVTDAHFTFPLAFVSSSDQRDRSSSSPLSGPILQNTNSTASLGAYCCSRTPRLPTKCKVVL